MELSDSVRDGYDAYVVFIIQMSGVKVFKPNIRTDLTFAKDLKICLNDVVIVAAGHLAQMKVHFPAVRYCIEKLPHHFRLQITYLSRSMFKSYTR